MAKRIIIILIMLGFSSSFYYIYPDEELEKNLQINFLDIGQGDATLIRFENDKKMLIDCAIDARIIEALGRHMSFFDRKIDYLVVTHPDLDHYGGCQEVLERFDVGEIILNGDEKPDKTWSSFIEAIEAEESLITISSGMKWTIGSSTLDFLLPDGFTSSKVEGNGRSIVIKISSGEVDVLLMADAEVVNESYLLQKYNEYLKSEIIKIGHHGSVGSNSQSFLEKVQPQEAIVSCGKDNSFGHPSLRIIKRLERIGARVWRTDLNSDIILTIYGDENRYEIAN